MRVISENGQVDVPYEVATFTCGPDHRVHAVVGDRDYYMTEFSNLDHCKSELVSLRECYINKNPIYRFGRP